MDTELRPFLAHSDALAWALDRAAGLLIAAEIEAAVDPTPFNIEQLRGAERRLGLIHDLYTARRQN
jgi:hypothetical protein